MPNYSVMVDQKYRWDYAYCAEENIVSVRNVQVSAYIGKGRVVRTHHKHTRSTTYCHRPCTHTHTHTHAGQNISLLMDVTNTRKWSHVKSSVCQHAEA